MTDGQVTAGSGDPGSDQQHSAFLEAMSVLLLWKNFIIVNVFIIAAIVTAITFLMPKWYKAEASILPPKERDLFGSLGGSASTLLRGLTGRGMGQNQNTYNYFAILKSRTAMEAVVRKFDLVNVYEISDSSMEKAVKALNGNTSFEIQDDDNITIDVLDKDPQRAADMANYFVDLLNTMSIDLSTREARNNREFIEKRVEAARVDLHSAEDSLQGYQERSGMIVAPEAGNAGLSAIAQMYGLKARKEIELAIARRSVAQSNPMVGQLATEVEEIQKRIDKYPAIGIGSLRLYRDVAIQQKILEFLLPLYEQAKVDEQKDVPVLLVLDRAVAPERKVKPQRMLIVFVTSVLFFFASTLAAFLFHGFARPRADRTSLEQWLHDRSIRIAALYRVRRL